MIYIRLSSETLLTGAFTGNFPPHAVTVLSTTSLEINIRDRSSMTTATYHTGGVVVIELYF